MNIFSTGDRIVQLTIGTGNTLVGISRYPDEEGFVLAIIEIKTPLPIGVPLEQPVPESEQGDEIHLLFTNPDSVDVYIRMLESVKSFLINGVPEVDDE